MERGEGGREEGGGEGRRRCREIEREREREEGEGEREGEREREGEINCDLLKISLLSTLVFIVYSG